MLLRTSRTDPSEDFTKAVRCFECGLFEESAAQLRELLRQDPTNDDASYFLRLIERRMAPPSLPGPNLLIWQVDPAQAWEGDWIRLLLSGCAHAEVVDKTWTVEAPRMIVVDNGLVEGKAAYYRRAFDRGCRIVLVHLSDEAFRDDTAAYRYCEAVLRNYRSEVMAAHARVQFFPLGYKSCFALGESTSRPAGSRRYLWSFAGDVKKSTRRTMLTSLNALPRGFVHLTEGFGSADSLSTETYRSLLEDTVFVPCPGGWANLESFRVYEALEAGCIPIVERRPGFDYFTDLLGAHPIPTVSTWSEAAELMSKWSPDEVESRRLSCEHWWRVYRRRLRATFTATVAESLR